MPQKDDKNCSVPVYFFWRLPLVCSHPITRETAFVTDFYSHLTSQNTKAKGVSLPETSLLMALMVFGVMLSASIFGPGIESAYRTTGDQMQLVMNDQGQGEWQVAGSNQTYGRGELRAGNHITSSYVRGEDTPQSAGTQWVERELSSRFLQAGRNNPNSLKSSHEETAEENSTQAAIEAMRMETTGVNGLTQSVVNDVRQKVAQELKANTLSQAAQGKLKTFAKRLQNQNLDFVYHKAKRAQTLMNQIPTCSEQQTSHCLTPQYVKAMTSQVTRGELALAQMDQLTPEHAEDCLNRETDAQHDNLLCQWLGDVTLNPELNTPEQKAWLKQMALDYGEQAQTLKAQLHEIKANSAHSPDALLPEAEAKNTVSKAPCKKKRPAQS